MFKNFNRSDQTIFFIALIGVAAFSFLTANESILFSKDTQVNAPVFGKLTLAKNDVRQKKVKQFKWAQTKKKSLVHVGDSLFTGPDSVARIEMQNGGKIEIQPNSMIFFDKSSDQFSFNLEFGKIEGSFQGGKYNVKVGNQMVSIDSANGGELSLEKSNVGNGVSIESKSGEFDILTAEGAKRIAGGAGLNMSPDGTTDAKGLEELALKEVLRKKEEREAKEKEAQLVAALRKTQFTWLKPQESQIFEISLDVNQRVVSYPVVDLEWRANMETGPVVLEISTLEDFSSIAYKTVTAESHWRTPELAEGIYYARIRPEKVLDSWNAQTQFGVSRGQAAKLPAPVLKTVDISYRWPAEKPIEIEWQRVPLSAKYKVEVSERHDFSKIAQTFSSRKTKTEFPAAGSGRYFFRVRAESAAGIPGEFSQAGTITVNSDRPRIEAVPPQDVLGESPKAQPPVVEMPLRWSPLGEGTTYQVEVSDNPAFTNAAQVTTKSPETKIKVRNPGTYFARVRAVGPTGQGLSDFSEPKPFEYKYRVPLTTPVPREPAENFTLFFQREEDIFFRLEWTAVRDAERYELEIAEDSEFTKIITTRASKEPRIALTSIGAEGTMYWRVRSINEKQISNWTKPRAMKLISSKKSTTDRLPAKVQNSNGGAN